MGSICCCYCQSKSEQKRNALKTMKEITPNIKHPDPLEVTTKEMTKYYKIPEKFTEEKEVFKYKGYRKVGYIDSGSFASVHKCVHINTGFIVAVKEIRIPMSLEKQKRRDDVLKDVKNELHILQKIRHPHIIRLIDHFIIEWKQKKRSVLYMFMQFAPGGSLSTLCDRYGPFNEKMCKQWLAQIMSGLIYMQRNGIAHRDLKLSNILLDESKDILISDFGLSRVVWRKDEDTELTSTTFCGTPPYMAPELLKMRYTKNKVDPVKEYFAFKVDVWAVGVVLFKLFNKEYPFPSKPKKALKYMKTKRYKFLSTVKPSPEMINFLDKIFEPEPNDRPEFKTMSTHPWIADVFQDIDGTAHKKIPQMASNMIS